MLANLGEFKETRLMNFCLGTFTDHCKQKVSIIQIQPFVSTMEESNYATSEDANIILLLKKTTLNWKLESIHDQGSPWSITNYYPTY